MIKVELLDHCGSDEAVANAARVSFADLRNWDKIPDGYTKERADKLIKYLAKHQHTSPFRHNSITVRCSAPVFIARQLMKHQAGLSWNEESRRYVDTPPTFYRPSVWRARPDGSIKQGSSDSVITSIELMYGDEVWNEPPSELYEAHLDDCIRLYEDMLRSGVAPEMARMVLPQSMMVNWVWTGNLLAFMHVVNLRTHSSAQLEAQEFGFKLYEILKCLFPVSCEALLEVHDAV